MRHERLLDLGGDGLRVQVCGERGHLVDRGLAVSPRDARGLPAVQGCGRRAGRRDGQGHGHAVVRRHAHGAGRVVVRRVDGVVLLRQVAGFGGSEVGFYGAWAHLVGS